MKASAIVLAGGFSQRFGEDKALVKLAGKPLILHVLDNLPRNIDEKIVAVSSEKQKTNLENVVRGKADIAVDKMNIQSPLVGALTGFENVNHEYCMLLPCDTPFVSSEVTMLLLELCINRSAAIPRSPECFIEPLQAAYDAEGAAEAAKTALAQGDKNLQSMIDCLSNVRYVSTLVIRQIDPKLISFYNINTLNDLKKVEAIIRRKKIKASPVEA